jgi:hypothetical protein
MQGTRPPFPPIRWKGPGIGGSEKGRPPISAGASTQRTSLTESRVRVTDGRVRSSTQRTSLTESRARSSTQRTRLIDS